MVYTTNTMAGTLYVVGTPIGNLGDMTLRGLETFRLVDVIFCEDTRVTKKLLQHYKIATPCVSYHSFSGFRKIRQAIDLLEQGGDIALVSDAGTPTISDPFLLWYGLVAPTTTRHTVPS